MNRLYGQESYGQEEEQEDYSGGGGYTGGGYAPQAPQQDPSIDYAQQAVKGYSKQAKAQKKALKELLKSIEKQYSTDLGEVNTQYDKDVTTGTTELDKAKQQDLLRLSGMFSFANADPNDEQRMQYTQRTSNDYAGQLTDLIAKLQEGKNKNITSLNEAKGKNTTSAKQGYQDTLSQIEEAKAQAQYKVAQLLYQMQQAAAKKKVSSASYYDPYAEDESGIFG
jgi:hypothetical protein